MGYFLERTLDCGKVYFVSICFACAKYLPGGNATFSFLVGLPCLASCPFFWLGGYLWGVPQIFDPALWGLTFVVVFSFLFGYEFFVFSAKDGNYPYRE